MATEIRRYRRERRMSTQQLAHRCAELGMPIKRSVLANLETERRSLLTVAELLILAEALKVSPILLAMPIASGEQTMEILPGMQASIFEAARWWRGEGSYLADVSDGPRLVIVDANEPTPPTEQIFAHQDLVAKWNMTNSQVRDTAFVAGRTADPDEKQRFETTLEALRTNLAHYEKELARRRADMRAANLIPPPLPPELTYLDDKQADQ